MMSAAVLMLLSASFCQAAGPRHISSSNRAFWGRERSGSIQDSISSARPVPVNAEQQLQQQQQQSNLLDGDHPHHHHPETERLKVPVPTSSGYLTVNAELGSEMFYLYYERREQSGGPLDTTPIIVWLQGGPGCSSLFG